MVFLNSIEAVKDLFDKRSALYADRPISRMLSMVGWDYNFAFMPYGQQWRDHRKLFHQYFNSGRVGKYHPIQLKHTRQFLRSLLQSPGEYVQHTKQLAAAIIMEITYGITLQSENDPYILIAHEALEGASQATLPGKFMVDTFPSMMKIPSWIPGGGFKRQAREWRKPTVEMVERPFLAVKKEVASGTAKSSVTAACLSNLPSKHSDTDEELIANVAGVSYAAGAGTSVAGMLSLILALVLHPQVQQKAQAELDSVLGDRLPTFEDKSRLPYVVALCNEVNRWRPPLPLALPHLLTQDDVYGKYYLPKGSLAIGNSWSILRDERIYGQNTESFQPERFLRSGVPPPIAQFGFGRRICVGRHLADDTFFIMAANLLKMFTISPAKDAMGKELPIPGTYSTRGTVSAPEPFQCSITARSDPIAQLIQERI